MRRAWLAVVLMLAGTANADAADARNGRALYETRCTGCHATSVHSGPRHAADSCAAIRAQVDRWNTHLGGTWSADEIDDVTLWLNERYYRFPVESGRCITPVALTTPRGRRPRRLTAGTRRAFTSRPG